MAVETNLFLGPLSIYRNAVGRTVIALAFLAAVAMSAPSEAHGPAPDVPPPPPNMAALFGGPFSLIDHDGSPRTDRDYSGRFLLISFGYTHCPDICPLDLSTMAAALELLGPTGEPVQPIFITIDPARDKPAVLKEYVLNFHPRLIGLSGSERQISRVAKAYRVHRSKIIVEDAPPGNYLANHSSLTYLMGRNGDFVTMFPHGTAPRFMADAIRRHILRLTP
ncbi:MAG: SCO family protein [Proteobacteria bacterium]|nr:SCO family protein [Pseudomonadota bacterium]